VSESLWAASAEELLAATASSAPTPGGGSIAAISGALGVGLVQMAVAVSRDAALDSFALRLASLQQAIVPAADGDVRDFTALMGAYGMPRGDDAERAARSAAIESASIAATEGPLSLVGSLVDAVALSRELDALVKPGIRSDVLAGRDIMLGAARAAVRTADINLDQLARLGSEVEPGLRARRDALVAELEETA
jgi:formiminotetrahydrofolate cyclodeaminase